MLKKKGNKKLVKRIEKWLKRNWGSSSFSHKEIMSPKKSKMNFIFSPQVFGNAIGSISRDIKDGIAVGSTLTELNKKLEKSIIELVEDFDDGIILLFDELDLAYNVNDPNYKHRLIGLLVASYYFFNKYQNKIKVLLFLRNDIFNNLDFQDKNKIKDNLVEFLDWDKDSFDSSLSLKRIVAARIKSNINSEDSDFDNNWNVIFETGNIGRNQRKWNYMIERTFVRPRDVIKFMNLALEQAKLRLSDDPSSCDKIINDDIAKIRSKYSTYLFEELNDEIISKYPAYKNYMEILRDNRNMSFNLEKFTASYENVKERQDITENVDTILERLYEFSIIGFYKPGGGGFGGSEYRFQYNSDYQAFNPRASKFKVHQGFKEYLELID